MFSNVSAEYVPSEELQPDFAFTLPEHHVVHNSSTLNVTTELLERPAEQYGWEDNLAFIHVDEGREYTYGELIEMVNTFGNALRSLGVGPGDRVLFRSGELSEIIAYNFAMWKIGAIFTPATLTHSRTELGYELRDTEAEVVIGHAGNMEETYYAVSDAPAVDHVIGIPTADDPPDDVDIDVEIHDHETLVEGESAPLEAAETAPFDVCNIMYTSGTTGKPKGCIWTHASAVSNGVLTTRDRQLTAEDRPFTHGPIGHALGLEERMFFPWHDESVPIVKQSPSPRDVLEVMESFDVTHFSAVPTMLRLMADQDDFEEFDLSSLKWIGLSGETTNQETAELITDAFGVEPCNLVGMTALGKHYMISHEAERKVAPATSVGRPAPGYEAKIVDDDGNELERGDLGRLAIRGPVGIAYWQNEHPDIERRQQKDSMDGWSLTDDIYRKDEDGWFWFMSRVDDLIVTGGRQVAAPEVENRLDEHPAVEESAVIGKPDETRGEIVKAFVAVADDESPDDSLGERLQDYCKDKLAKYKYPREIDFLDELPKDEVGKVQRAELREQDT